MALGPTTASMPDGQVGVPYSFQVDMNVVLNEFIAFYGTNAVKPLTVRSLSLLDPRYAGVRVGNFQTTSPIPGIDMDGSGLISGTPTVANSFITPIMFITATWAIPPPPGVTTDVIVVNGWRINGPGNRSYPIF